MRSSVRAALIAIACALSLTTEAGSRERLFRKFDWRDGLPVTGVRSLAQDADGFLWIATRGGIARFDGARVKTVDRGDAELLPGSGDHGVFWRSASDGAIRQAEQERGVPVPGPRADPVLHATSGVVASDGGLWLVLERRLWRRDPSGSWDDVEIADPAVSAADVRALRPARDGSVFLFQAGHVSVIARDGSITTVLATPGASDSAVALGEERFLVGTRDGTMVDWKAGTRREIAAGTGRILDVVERGAARWILSENALTVLRDDRVGEAIEVDVGWVGSGDLLVDREGGLWCGTAHGLLHFPEPDTVAWNFATATDEYGAVDASNGVLFSPAGSASPVLFGRDAAGWGPATLGIESSEPGCLGPDGRLWIVQPGAVVEFASDRAVRRHALPGLKEAGRCAPTADGSRWVGTNLGLLLLRPGVAPDVVPVPFASEKDGFAIYQAPNRALFAGPASGDLVCRADAEQARMDRAVWSCAPVEGAGRFNDFIALPSGDVLAATTDRGILRLHDERWEPLGGDVALGDREISALAPALGGGVWVAGPGIAFRVIEGREVRRGLERVETLGAWQGLTSVNVSDIAESDDGTLWLAAPASLIEVPRSARIATPLPPEIELVEVTVDGEVVAGAGPLELQRGWRRMSLRFAALSYRDPSLLRYRIRLHPDEPWQAPTVVPLFRFSATSPGDYFVEAQASLDGRQWSAVPAHFRFLVPRPWYRSFWFITLAVVLVAAAVFAFARARLAVERRLMRQRTRIARDLHDELGSGLGSIGLLAGIVARPEVPTERRTNLADQIRSVAQELSTSLSDIVWSLRPGEASLASLITHLIERGTALFPGDRPRLEIDAPAPIPHQRLSLAVRRNVLLIALEALHNAARHSDARKVRLSMSASRRGYCLTIVDDGRGMERSLADSRRGSVPDGVGLLSMRSRALEIGAQLSFGASPEGGTLVRLVFSPLSEGRVNAGDTPVA